jgi:hypothetical protein
MLFFTIFAYPVIFNAGEFWNWTTGIFSHSGKYGTGAEGFINLSEVPGNFMLLVRENRMLFLTGLGSLLIALSLLFLHPVKGSVQGKAIRAVIAIIVSELAAMAFILKHFSLYYFTPFTGFTCLLILLGAIAILYSNRISGKRFYKCSTVTTISLLSVFLVSAQVQEIRSDLKINYLKTARIQKENERIHGMVDPRKPIIISGAYFGSPFIEFAQFIGFIMSARLKGFYKEYLKEKYPDCFFYVYWSDRFNYWSDLVEFDNILEKTASSLYVYTGKDKQDDLKIIEDRMWKFLDSNAVSKKILFLDQKSGEQLIEFTIEKNVQ